MKYSELPLKWKNVALEMETSHVKQALTEMRAFEDLRDPEIFEEYVREQIFSNEYEIKKNAFKHLELVRIH